MAVKIFFCYAHEDEDLLNKLKRHLWPLQRQGLIAVWHDRDISAGTAWEQEISQHLNEAQIILLLVSPDFMYSEYCYGVEMKRAIERHQRGEARVIPIIVRHVYWQGILGYLQALPTDAKPVRSWSDVDEAFFDVAEGIRRIANDIKERNAFMATEAPSRKGSFDQLLNSPSEPSMANDEPSQLSVDVDTKPDTRPKLNHAQNILDTSVSALKPVQGSQAATLASSAQPQTVRQLTLDTHPSLNRKIKALVLIVASLLIIGVSLYAIVSSSEANNRQPLHLQTTPTANASASPTSSQDSPTTTTTTSKHLVIPCDQNNPGNCGNKIRIELATVTVKPEQTETELKFTLINQDTVDFSSVYFSAITLAVNYGKQFIGQGPGTSNRWAITRGSSVSLPVSFNLLLQVNVIYTIFIDLSTNRGHIYYIPTNLVL